MNYAEIVSAVNVARYVVEKQYRSFRTWAVTEGWTEDNVERIRRGLRIPKLSVREKSNLLADMKRRHSHLYHVAAYYMEGHIYCDAARAANIINGYCMTLLASDLDRALEGTSSRRGRS